MSDFEVITDGQNFAQRDRFKRISQRDIIPGGIKNPALGEVILEEVTEIASATIGNNVQILLTHTLSQKNNAKMLNVPDISIYLTSVATNNQLPGGSAVDESQWQVIGPWNDWGTTDNKNSKTKLYVRNVSAGSTLVLFRVKSRYLTNRRDATGATT